MALNLNFSNKGSWVRIGEDIWIFVAYGDRGIQLLIEAPKELFIERNAAPPPKFAHLNPRKNSDTI